MTTRRYDDLDLAVALLLTSGRDIDAAIEALAAARARQREAIAAYRRAADALRAD